MKILAVNFLRLGDIFMTAPIMAQIKNRYPDCELHCVIFEDFKVAASVVEDVDHWHFLSRTEVRRAMESLDEGLLAPLDVLNSFVERVNGQRFHQVYSLSQTLATAAFLTLIDAPQKFNTTNLESIAGHYLDRYRDALGFGSEPVTWNFKGSSFEPTMENRIVIQAISSDERKAWSAENWLALEGELKRQSPGVEVVYACAPNERRELESLLGVDRDIRALRLPEVMTLLNSSRCLITLDTSISHLSNGSACRVVELFFGTADMTKQAVYKEGAILVAPPADCCPSMAGEVCPHVRRDCAKDVTPELVAGLALHGTLSSPTAARVFRTAHHPRWCMESILAFERKERHEVGTGN